VALIPLADYPRVTVILRDVPQDAVEAIVTAIQDGHLDLAVEITRNSSNFHQIGRLVAEHPDVLVGAGTILNLDDARQAADMGCRFILSPVVLPADVIGFAHDAGMLTIPGAYTPTEVHAAVHNGADIVKLFPVRDLSPSYVRDIRAPLGPIPFMGVGGVSVANIPAMFDRGLEYIGIGSSLFGKQLDRMNTDAIAQTLTDLAILRPPTTR